MIALLRTYLRPYRATLALVVGLLVIQALATLYLPELNGAIINNGVATGDIDYILSTGALMLGISAVVVVASIIAVYFGSRTGMAFGRDVRSSIFRTVESFSRAELDTFGTASLITRNTNDVQQVQMVVLMGLNMMIIAPILAVGGIIMALRQDIPLSGILIVVLPVMALIVGTLMAKALPLFQAMQVKVDRVNQVTREALSGIRVIRAFVRTRHEEERFDVANRDLTATSLRVNRMFAVMIPLLMAVFNLSSVAILWFGSIRVDSGQMPIGNLIAFLQYVMQILFAVMMAVFMFIMVPRAVVSSGRIQEVLRTTPSIRDPEDPHPAPLGTGTLTFRDVEFRYPGAQDPVLRDISLVVEPGKTTAIVGSTEWTAHAGRRTSGGTSGSGAAHAASSSLICEKTISRYVSLLVISSSCVPMPTMVPASRTTIRSAPMIVPTRWATMTTVASAISSARAARRRASVLKSRAEKLSSKT
jgi:ATP-binding cassette subfamily B protein